MDTNGVNKKLESAFIICPIGDQFSTTRRNSDALNETVLKPVLSEFFKRVDAPLDLIKPGSITAQVIILLSSVDLVVANLTDINPNVMYELAVRHAARKPVILLAEVGTVPPFDLLTERIIFYTNDIAGVNEVKNQLRNAIINTLENPDHDNPIYIALNQKLISEIAIGDDSNSIILKKLLEFEQILRNLTESNRILNEPIFPQRDYTDILKVPKVLTLSIKGKDEITEADTDFLHKCLENGPWKLMSNFIASKTSKDEIEVNVLISAMHLHDLESLLHNHNYKVAVKFKGLESLLKNSK